MPAERTIPLPAEAAGGSAEDHEHGSGPEHRLDGSTISTHVLDVTTGRPAAGVAVRLLRGQGDGWTELRGGTTGADGRLRNLEPDGGAGAGRYRLVFGVGDYFAASGVAPFFPEVTVDFAIGDTAEHYHVPLLAGPYSYTTYRGS